MQKVNPKYGMAVHPVCDLFPLMNDAELLQLAEDMTLALSSCHDVTSYVGDQVLTPVESKNIHFGQIAAENTFPACSY
jgi:hypothetical protein